MLTYVFILLGGPSQASARPTVYTSTFGCTFKGRRASRNKCKHMLSRVTRPVPQMEFTPVFSGVCVAGSLVSV
jgi:hypothetical protein